MCESCGERVSPITGMCDSCRMAYLEQFYESDIEADDHADRYDIGLLERMMAV